MSPIPRTLVRLTQRIRNPTLRNRTLNLIERATQEPDLTHFTQAMLKYEISPPITYLPYSQ